MTRGRRAQPVASIEWTARAVRDLRDIEVYIGADDPAAAARWIARIIAGADAAARSPLAGRVVPEREEHGVREVFVRNYRVVYRVRESSILVLTVFEGHRLFPTNTIPDE